MEIIIAIISALAIVISSCVTVISKKKQQKNQHREDLLTYVLAPIHSLLWDIDINAVKQKDAEDILEKIHSTIKSELSDTPRDLLYSVRKLMKSVRENKPSWKKDFSDFKKTLIDEHTRCKRILGYPEPTFMRRGILPETKIEMFNWGILGAVFALAGLALAQLAIEKPEDFWQIIKDLPTTIIGWGAIFALVFFLICFVGLIVSLVLEVIAFFSKPKG